MRQELTEHKIFEVVRDGVLACLNAGLDALKTGRSTYQATESDQYAYKVAERLMEVGTALDRLILSIELIGTPLPVDLKFVTRADALSYQIENAYLRIAGVLDRVSLLTNSILLLNVPEMKCNLQLVVKAIKASHPQVAELLVNLKQSTDPIRLRRNKAIHHEAFSTKELATLNAHDRLYLGERGETDLTEAADKVRADFSSASKEELQSLSKEVMRLVNSIFHELQAPLTENVSALSR